MNFPFLPLHNLRICLGDYLADPDESTGLLYEETQESIEHMHYTIADFMLSSKEDAVLKRYMRTWQEQIRQLFDQVPLSWVEDLDPDDPPLFDDPSSRRMNVCYECFRLLKEMQVQYPVYFDKKCSPPLIYIEIEKSMYQHKVLIIEQWMEQKGQHLHHLWEIIHFTIQRLWDQQSMRFSYQEHDYIWNLVTQLMAQINTVGDNIQLSNLHSLLFYLNFNEISFLHHLTTDVSKELESIVIPAQKINLLQEFKRTLGDIMIRNDQSLDPGNPPINIMFKRWIKARLEELQA